MSKEAELPSVPYRSGTVVVEAWGALYDHPSYCRPASASTLPHMVLPIGYKVRVPLPSYTQEGVTVDYLCDIQQGESGPVFRVCASDDEHNAVTSDSATGAFQDIFKRRVGAKVGSVNGLTKLGLSTSNILKQLRKLPNAQPIFDRLDAAINFRPSTRPTRSKVGDSSSTDVVVVEGETSGTDGMAVTVVEGEGEGTVPAAAPKQRKPRKVAVTATAVPEGVQPELVVDGVEMQADATSGSPLEVKPKRVYRKRVREEGQTDISASTDGTSEPQPAPISVDGTNHVQADGTAPAPAAATKVRKPRAKKANPPSLPEDGANESNVVPVDGNSATEGEPTNSANPTDLGTNGGGEAGGRAADEGTAANPPSTIPSKRQQRKRNREGEENATGDAEGGAPKTRKGTKAIQPTLTQFLGTGDQPATVATQEVVEVPAAPVVKKIVPSILPALDGGDRKKARAAFEAEVESGGYPFPEALLQNIKNRKRFRMFQWMYMSERAKYELCRKQKDRGADNAQTNDGPAAVQQQPDAQPGQAAAIPLPVAQPISVVDEKSNSVPPKAIATPMKGSSRKGRGENSNSISIVSNPQPSPAKPIEVSVAPKAVSAGRGSTSRGRSKKGE